MINSFARSPLWGALFQDAETASALSETAILGYICQFEMAWTGGLEAAGVIDSDQARAAQTAIGAFKPDFKKVAEAAERDGLPVPELVCQMRRGLSEHDAAAIHKGATSQDVLDTSFVLACLDILHVFEGRLTDVVNGLDRLHKAYGTNPLMGRTRMQAALPVTAADRIAAWQRPLTACLSDMTGLKARIGCLQAGGPVGLRDFAGKNTGLLLETVARDLGLKLTPVWHSDRSTMLDLGSWLTRLAGSCAKFGKDITLMAQQGLSEVALSGAGGSSAMPHKQNPVRGELLVALGRYVAAQNGLLSQAMIHEQERSGEAWALEWLTLPAMLEASGAALIMTNSLIGQIQHLGTSPSAD